jgi:hypothetical protein
VRTHRALTADDLLTLSVTAGEVRPHRRGRTLDVRLEAHVYGELVWECDSTYLSRGRGTEAAPSGESPPQASAGPPVARWRLPDDLGRRYGAVSGDRNPIHLYPLTAKAFGFPRHIAHGMWTKARSIAAIENRLPEAVTVEVAFKKPVFLPGTVVFAARQDDDGWTFALTNPKDGSPHLLGRTTAA